MKILLIDAVMYGHHKAYFEALLHGLKGQIVGVVPSEYQNSQDCLLQVDFYKENMNPQSAHVFAYIKWIWNLHKIVKREKPDIVHFLYGDIMYRYFGVGLGLLRNTKVMVTFHQIRRSRARDFSLKRICSKIMWSVLHTDKLVSDFKGLGIQNVRMVEYPCFGDNRMVSKEEAQRALGFDAGDTPVLLALGGTRHDKGLDLLLEALNEVKAPFYLLIAGYPEMYNEQYIVEHTKKYSNQVKYILKYLSDEEFSLSIAATDFVVLPYRRSFDGASGPLGEGVAKNKIIIGPEHGSLGKTIQENHLGYIFETENTLSLSNTIQKALISPFELDERYKAYQKKISVAEFVESYRKIYEEKMI